jgi:hypothetical protein
MPGILGFLTILENRWNVIPYWAGLFVGTWVAVGPPKNTLLSIKYGPDMEPARFSKGLEKLLNDRPTP